MTAKKITDWVCVVWLVVTAALLAMGHWVDALETLVWFFLGAAVVLGDPPNGSRLRTKTNCEERAHEP